MRFRFPGLGELAALFFADTSVAGAIDGLRCSKERLIRVVQINQAKAKERAAQQADALREADRLAAEALAAQSEADHAARVANRLEGLCA